MWRTNIPIRDFIYGMNKSHYYGTHKHTKSTSTQVSNFKQHLLRMTIDVCTRKAISSTEAIYRAQNVRSVQKNNPESIRFMETKRQPATKHDMRGIVKSHTVNESYVR